MFLRFLSKQGLKRALSAAHLVVLITSLLLSPVAQAQTLRLTIGTAMNVRVLSDDSLLKVATLAAGSVVEIPDKYKVEINGRVNAKKTLNNWLTKAGYSKGDINRKIPDPKMDFYFPVRVVSAAKGSRNAKSVIGKTQYMALRVLTRGSTRMTVKQAAPVYRGPSDMEPLLPDYSPAPQQQVAQAADTSASTEARGTCENCDRPEIDPAPQASSFLQASERFKTEVPRSFDEEFVSNDLPTLDPKFFRAGARCERFIKNDGSGYGSYGQAVLKYISQEPEYMSNTNGVAQKGCPNFNTFSPAQRRHFWVWTFAALAWQESKCNHQGRDSSASINPNGVAAGLYQNEKSDRLRSNRDRAIGGTYCGGDIYNMNTNTRCAVGSLLPLLRKGLGPLSRQDQPYGPFKYLEHGEWVRTRGGRIFIKSFTKTLIKTYPGCGSAGAL